MKLASEYRRRKLGGVATWRRGKVHGVWAREKCQQELYDDLHSSPSPARSAGSHFSPVIPSKLACPRRAGQPTYSSILLGLSFSFSLSRHPILSDMNHLSTEAYLPSGTVPAWMSAPVVNDLLGADSNIRQPGFGRTSPPARVVPHCPVSLYASRACLCACGWPGGVGS